MHACIQVEAASAACNLQGAAMDVRAAEGCRNGTISGGGAVDARGATEVSAAVSGGSSHGVTSVSKRLMMNCVL